MSLVLQKRLTLIKSNQLKYFIWKKTQRDKATAAFFNLTECLEPPSSCPSLRAASCMNRFCAVIPGILRIQGAGFSQFCTMNQQGEGLDTKLGASKAPAQNSTFSWEIPSSMRSKIMARQDSPQLKVAFFPSYRNHNATDHYICIFGWAWRLA